MASLIAELQTGGRPFSERTVLIVDEASTLSNRDHHTLVAAVREAGGLMRTIGDPAQHRAVEAGGLWAHLVTDLADHIPVLTLNRRQAAVEMTDVRLANAEYRDGLIGRALERLATNQRIVTAPTADELLDHLVADWYTDRQAAPDSPARMMAESHSVRRRLNARAQALLTADGTLTGPGVEIGGERFHVGDHVITRTQDRTLRHGDGHMLRNGSTGTITAITHDLNGRPEITVDFDRHGTLTLPHEFLTRHLRPGIDGGLAPAYAITTHAAQGSTYRAGRMLTTDASTREGIYVGLTRGTTDTRLYLVATDELTPTDRSDVGLPILTDTRTALDALAHHLAAPDPASVIAATDPDARTVHHLRTHTLDELRTRAPSDLTARRALRLIADTTAAHALHHPPAQVVDRHGPRPAAASPLRPAWDELVTRTITHHVIHGDADTPAAQRSRARVTAAATHLDTLTTAIDHHHRATAVRDLAAQLRTARSTLPLDDTLIARLSERLEAHVTTAVAAMPGYLVELLGDRPDHDTPAARGPWDQAATAIERVRHRHGYTPTTALHRRHATRTGARPRHRRPARPPHHWPRARRPPATDPRHRPHHRHPPLTTTGRRRPCGSTVRRRGSTRNLRASTRNRAGVKVCAKVCINPARSA